MAPDTPAVSHLAAFTVGDWLVDPKACHLTRGDTTVKRRPQLLDLLVCLARRHGEIVLKDEILAEVWPGQFIADSGLSRCIAELRQLLQDEVQQPRYIETISKRGYRMIAPVAWLPSRAQPEERRQRAAAPPSDAPEADTRVRPWPRRVSMAAALLVGVVALITVFMRARGPAQVLSQQDTVLLAFENHTGEEVFDQAIPLATAIQMEQSPYLGLLSPARIQEVLRMMKRPPDTAITREVGLELCERVGGRALIVTSLARLGAQYVIGLEAVGCASGTILARRQATTEQKERVLKALEGAASEIRLAVGESAASVQRYNAPLVEGTTSSLEALRALREGDLARERGQVDQAVGLYRRAVALDPNFALAQNRLGWMSWEDESDEGFRKAYALREQVTLPERLEIEAAYHRFVTGDRARVLQALELLTRTYPRRASARRDLAFEHIDSGRFEAALAEAGEALRLEPNSPLTMATLARAQLFLNRVADARRTAESALALGGGSLTVHRVLFYCALISGDLTGLARERGWAAEHTPPTWLEDEAEEAVKGGRLNDALAFIRRYEAWAAGRNLADFATRMRLRAARYEALSGLGQRAMRRVEDEVRRPLTPGALLDAVRAAVSAGGFDQAERLLDQLDRVGPPGEWGIWMARTYRAAVAAGRGRTAEALETLAPLRPIELGYGCSLEPLLVRAQVHYRAGDWANARAAFETILAHSTIDSARKILPQAQLGLARTLARAGDPAASRGAYETLFSWWEHADPGLPLLLEARREYEAVALQ